jgi:hypothetical protein
MRRFAVALLVGTSIGGATLGAHHGYGGFFDPQQRTVLVDGTLEDLDYANPHVVMTIRTPDSVMYTITWQSPGWLQQAAAVTKTTFHAGDHLIVIGAPSRDARSREVTRIREVRRPTDGWIWRSGAPFAPPTP